MEKNDKRKIDVRLGRWSQKNIQECIETMTVKKYCQTLDKFLRIAKEKYCQNEDLDKSVLRQFISLEENSTVIIPKI